MKPKPVTIILVTYVIGLSVGGFLGGCAGQQCPNESSGPLFGPIHPRGKVSFRENAHLHPDCEFEVIAKIECTVALRSREAVEEHHEARQCLLNKGTALGADAIMDREDILEPLHDPPRWLLRGLAIKYTNYACRCGTGQVYY